MYKVRISNGTVKAGADGVISAMAVTTDGRVSLMVETHDGGETWSQELSRWELAELGNPLPGLLVVEVENADEIADYIASRDWAPTLADADAYADEIAQEIAELETGSDEYEEICGVRFCGYWKE